MHRINDIIKTSKNILIISHVNPDGDTLGAMCSVWGFIKSEYKKQANMLMLGKLPAIYENIPYIKFAKSIEDYDKSREFDLVITVDVASLDRIIDAKIFFEKAKFTVNIDHHETNNRFGDIALVKDTSSTCEVLFDFFEAIGFKIDLEIATSLYYGILTDTGGFRFTNTTSRVLEIASELLKKGVNPQEVFKYCYETKSKEMVLLQNYCVSKACFENNNKIVYTTIYKKDMERFGAKDEHTDGIAETLRGIISTEVSFVVKEVDEKICKISMRSKNIDIAKVCEQFNGGGHKHAAGCTIKASCKNATEKLLEILKREVDCLEE